MGGDHHARGAQGRALRIALAANGLLLVAQVVGGLAFGSLALLADAGHLLTDVAGLAIALAGLTLAARPASARHSFGLQRAEVLGAQANGVILLATAAWVTVEALRRLGGDSDVEGVGLIALAAVGLAVNLGSAGLVSRSRGASIGMRGALVHLLADAAGSAGALVAGVAVVVFDATWADPAVALLIAALVAWSAWRLLRDAAHVLLEGTPEGMDPLAVEAALAGDADVQAVHHLHLWNLASDAPAASAHVVLTGEPSLHDAQAIGDRLKGVLADRFGVAHATLELECHECRPPAVDRAGAAGSSPDDRV